MKLLSLLLLSSLSTIALANTEIYCESKNLTLKIAKVNDSLSANYAVDGILNTGADVFVEDFYLSERILTASLNIDSQARKIELTAIKNKQNFYQGKIYFGKKSQRVDCYQKE